MESDLKNHLLKMARQADFDLDRQILFDAVIRIEKLEHAYQELLNKYNKLQCQNRRSVVEVLSSMPNAGKDSDFDCRSRAIDEKA